MYLACECNAIGINSETCDAETGQCDCKTNYGQRQCDQCSDGYYSFPTCYGNNHFESAKYISFHCCFSQCFSENYSKYKILNFVSL